MGQSYGTLFKLDFVSLWTQTVLLPDPCDKVLLRGGETFTPFGKVPESSNRCNNVCYVRFPQRVLPAMVENASSKGLQEDRGKSWADMSLITCRTLRKEKYLEG